MCASRPARLRAAPHEIASQFGVDPNLDPEMAMVLQMSAQEAEAAAARVGVATEGGGDAMEVDEETLLQRALEMSRQDDQSRQGADGGGTSGAQAQPQPQAQGAGMFDAEDADLQMAMQMSLMEATEQAKKEDKSGKDGEGKDGEGQ